MCFYWLVSGRGKELAYPLLRFCISLNACTYKSNLYREISMLSPRSKPGSVCVIFFRLLWMLLRTIIILIVCLWCKSFTLKINLGLESFISTSRTFFTFDLWHQNSHLCHILAKYDYALSNFRIVTIVLAIDITLSRSLSKYKVSGLRIWSLCQLYCYAVHFYLSWSTPISFTRTCVLTVFSDTVSFDISFCWSV